ncbi:UNVERIFIED_CONTAM: hypothetical protein Sangu_3093200 [Sesamum angustifolium]|uniref:Uncharacterized protein n=1 Tax=Sesamum angustifolium TaxID=2727405 RepID=A0AAW2K7L4_9LAMI
MGEKSTGEDLSEATFGRMSPDLSAFGRTGRWSLRQAIATPCRLLDEFSKEKEDIGEKEEEEEGSSPGE